MKQNTIHEAQEEIEKHCEALCDFISHTFDEEEDHQHATRIVVGYLAMTLLRVIRSRISIELREKIITNIENYLRERIKEP